MPDEVSDRPTEGSQSAGNGARENDELYHQSPHHPAAGATPPSRESNFNQALIYNYSQPFNKRITLGELGFASLALGVWFIVFAAGIFISTAEMRAAIKNPDINQFVKLGYLGIICLSYTLTNVLFLTCLAAFIGCMSRRWQVGDDFQTIPSEATSVDGTRVYMAAVLRGFFLYLMFISGFLVVSTEKTVVETEFAQYIRIAGFTSILGFIVGYDPNLLVRFIHRILSLANLQLDRTNASPAGRRRTNGDGPPALDTARAPALPR